MLNQAQVDEMRIAGSSRATLHAGTLHRRLVQAHAYSSSVQIKMPTVGAPLPGHIYISEEPLQAEIAGVQFRSITMICNGAACRSGHLRTSKGSPNLTPVYLN